MRIYPQRPDHNTGNYVPYSLRTVSGFFNVQQSYYSNSCLTNDLPITSWMPYHWDMCWAAGDVSRELAIKLETHSRQQNMFTIKPGLTKWKLLAESWTIGFDIGFK